MGTLLAFTMVAISVLILRYVPPDQMPLPPSLQESIDSVALQYNGILQKTNQEEADSMIEDPLLAKEVAEG